MLSGHIMELRYENMIMCNNVSNYVKTTIRVICTLIIILLVCGCNNKRETTDSKEIYHVTAFHTWMDDKMDYSCFPVKYQDDTLLCCYDIPSFYQRLSIQIVPENVFCDMMYECFRDNAPYEISKELYDDLSKSRNFVSFDSDIDELYQKSGAQGLIDYFNGIEDKWKFEKNHPDAFNYLVYLLWQNRIFVSIYFEGIGWSIYDSNNG